jgi:hypothetical protein
MQIQPAQCPRALPPRKDDGRLDIDWTFISKKEGGQKLIAYVPAASSSKSGVTVGTGIDLGARCEADIANLDISADFKSKLKPYVNKKQKQHGWLQARSLREVSTRGANRNRLSQFSVWVPGNTNAKFLEAAHLANVDSGPIVLNKELERHLTSPNETVLPSISTGSTIIESCAGLLAALRSGADLSEATEHAEFASYSMCLAGAVTRCGAAPTGSRFSAEAVDRQIYEYMDLATVRSSLAPRRPSEHYRFSDFDFPSAQINPLSLTLSGQDFEYAIDVLASGDFCGQNGNLLMRFTDRSTVGTYDNTSILILNWP